MRFLILFIKYFCLLGLGILPFTKIDPVFFNVVLGSLFLVYLLANYIEVKKKVITSKTSFNQTRFFNYYSFYLFISRLVKVGVVAVFIFLFLAPETRNFKIQPFLIAFLLGELTTGIFEVYLNYYGFYFMKDYFYYVHSKEEKIFSTEIDHYVWKYDVFYLVLKNSKTIKINPEYSKKSDRVEFVKELKHWLNSNSVKELAN